jgi:hypothetical protein
MIVCPQPPGTASASTPASDGSHWKKQAWKNIRKAVQFTISEIPDIALD